MFIALLFIICVDLLLFIINDSSNIEDGWGLVFMFYLGPLFIIQILVEVTVLFFLFILPAFRFSERECISSKRVFVFLLTFLGAIIACIVTHQMYTLAFVSRV